MALISPLDQFAPPSIGLRVKDSWRRHYYNLRAHTQALRWNRYEFAIGLMSGPSVNALAAMPGVVNPILTKEDVNDVPAGFVADPFLHREGEAWYLFFEVWNTRRQIGEVGCAVSWNLRHWRYLGIILTKAEHLSYPQVFTWQGDIYMALETAHAGRTSLYRAVRFPDCWELAQVIMEAPLVDPSLFFYEDRWWMFAETSPDMGHSELRLYMAQTPLGPWRPHPQNPLLTNDGLNARPAGRVFVDGDLVIRFAQECHPDYGTAVRAFRVSELTPERYVEQPLEGGRVRKRRLLGPGWGGWNSCGMHHIDVHRLDSRRLIACVDGR